MCVSANMQIVYYDHDILLELASRERLTWYCVWYIKPGVLCPHKDSIKPLPLG